MVQEWKYLGTDGSGPATGEARPVLPTAHTLRPERAQHQGLVGLGPAVGVPLPASGLLTPAGSRGAVACRGSGPFSALIPTRFILDDSALYLSDKCEVETLDLRRGGQGPAQCLLSPQQGAPSEGPLSVL